MSQIANLLENLPARLNQEQVDVLVRCGTSRIERIVSTGHASPEGFWYDQSEHEWVMLLRGQARIRFQRNSETVELNPGDHLLIPARLRHRVEWTSPGEPTVWLAVFLSDSPGKRIEGY